MIFSNYSEIVFSPKFDGFDGEHFSLLQERILASKMRHIDEELWTIIDEFPDYSVSSYGRVMKNTSSRLVSQTLNQQGILSVALFRDSECYRRSVATLVANGFIRDLKKEPFDTPVHQDGDKTNVHLSNLVWRPRWFAVKYHRQFNDPCPFRIYNKVKHVQSGKVFSNSLEAARHFCALERDVFFGILNETPIFPNGHKFVELCST